MTETHTITSLEKNDYYLGYLSLLEQLTVVQENNITFEEFCEQYDKKKSSTFVIKNITSDKIIATATILIERKFIHNLSSVGHIEDVVVHADYRNKGLGKLLIDHCVQYAVKNNCYKIVLCCSHKYIEFYEKCGFEYKNVEMNMYFNK